MPLDAGDSRCVKQPKYNVFAKSYVKAVLTRMPTGVNELLLVIRLHMSCLQYWATVTQPMTKAITFGANRFRFGKSNSLANSPI